MVTAEGGGDHIAHGAGVPELLVTPATWFAHVRGFALPPSAYNLLLFDYEAVSASRVPVCPAVSRSQVQAPRRSPTPSRGFQ